MAPKVARILVPIDFSDTSRAALEYAVGLATSLGASIELLNVVEDPIASEGWSPDLYLTDPQGLIDDLIEEATIRLERWKAGCGGVSVEVKAVIGIPSRTIVATASDDHCDLIAMGTHGRTGLPHVVLGSVAERVVRKAPCPVLTVRNAPEHPAEPKSEAVVLSAVPS